MPSRSPIDLETPGLRAVQYELADGTFELLFAALFLMSAGLLGAQAAAPGSVWSDLLAGPGLLIVLPGAAFLLDRLARWFKGRVTYPRTGYVGRKAAPEASPRLRRTIYVGVPLLVLAVLILLSLYRPILVPPDSGAWMESVPVFPAFFALMMGGLWVILAWRLRLPRFLFHALLTWAAGAAIFLARVGNALGTAFFFAAMAGILGISGLVVLLIYLRRNPDRHEERP